MKKQELLIKKMNEDIQNLIKRNKRLMIRINEKNTTIQNQREEIINKTNQVKNLTERVKNIDPLILSFNDKIKAKDTTIRVKNVLIVCAITGLIVVTILLIKLSL